MLGGRIIHKTTTSKREKKNNDKKGVKAKESPFSNSRAAFQLMCKRRAVWGGRLGRPTAKGKGTAECM